jgi:integrase
LRDNYVLFSDTDNRVHVSPHWLRREFRDVIVKCGLDDVYAKSDEHEKRCKNRDLHRLTSHSLRHYFISKIYNNTKNPIHTQKLARHQDFKSTQVYIFANKEELSGSLKDTFETSVDGSEFKEFAQVFKAWKQMKK